MKIIVTITGIRPDFIRMSHIFKKLDENFKHILIHTGQHYDELLSTVFFNELNIRTPDYILTTGKESTNHYEQLSYLSRAIIELFKKNNIKPDLILLLGDSNSVCVSLPLKKEGYKIGHIEGGMRSFDNRMLEEINRIVCDHCSDILFVYHEDYKKNLEHENIKSNVYIVGNTIIEPCHDFSFEIMKTPKKKDMILMDIHRPENFKYPNRLMRLIAFGNRCHIKYNLPIKLLYFKGLKDALDINNIDLKDIEMISLLPYKEYLNTVYHCKFIISDSGSAVEEAPLLQTPVLCPRDYTERPQSYKHYCSIKYDVESDNSTEVFQYIEDIETKNKKIDISWLGDGHTSKLIIKYIKKYLNSI